MEKKFAITIGRQCGSGGREIGFRLGELLGIKVYDNELITLAAEKKGIDADYLHRIDEKATNSLLYTLAVGSSLFRNHNVHTDMSINDRLFIGQTEVIREIVANESAIFVGRCADYILRKHEHCINLFFYADLPWRIAHLSNLEGTSQKEAEDKIAKKDKSRMNYYNFYTGKKWGKPENYDFCIDSSVLGIEGTAQWLAEMVRLYLVQNDENKGK
jgi:cytidylate kinase